jgi:hypothetical protein
MGCALQWHKYCEANGTNIGSLVPKLEAWCPNLVSIWVRVHVRILSVWCLIPGAHALFACRVFAPGPTRHEVVVALQHRRQLRILTKLSRRARFCYMLSVGPLDKGCACTPASCGCACRGLFPAMCKMVFSPPTLCLRRGSCVFRLVTRHTFTFTHVQYQLHQLAHPVRAHCAEPRGAGAVRAGSHGFVGSGPFLRRPVCTSPI